MSGEKRVEGVTSRGARLGYYLTAFLVSYGFLYRATNTLWSENEPSMTKYLWAILGSVSIAYLGMVIRCLCKDVPVPKYQLGVEGRFRVYLGVMIFMYCISYNVKEGNRVDASARALELILAGISIVQLSWPAEDFTPEHIGYTIQLGVVFAIIGAIGTKSWTSFIESIVCFPASLYIMSMLDNDDFQPDLI